jgi:hypothetical protein
MLKCNIFKTTSDVDMVYNKALVLNTVYKFVVEFFICSCLEFQMCFRFLDFKIQILEFPNIFECLHS